MTADRPEIFFKALAEKVVSAWRGRGHPARREMERAGTGAGARAELARQDCRLHDRQRHELTRHRRRELLYLPQAKIYDRSCALGPWIRLGTPKKTAREWTIRMHDSHAKDLPVFAGETSVGNIKRTFDELAAYLFRSQSFPHGAVLLTGTGIVPPDELHPPGAGCRRNRDCGNRRAAQFGRAWSNICLFIPFSWLARGAQAESAGTFQAVNPATGEPLPGEYPVSAWGDCDAALAAAAEAAATLRGMEPERIARFPGAFRRAHRRAEDRTRRTGASRNRRCPNRLGWPMWNCPGRPTSFARPRPRRAKARGRFRPSTQRCNIRSMLEPDRSGRRFRPEQFPVRLQWRGRRRFRRGHRRRAILSSRKGIRSHPGTARMLAEEALAASAETGLAAGDGPAGLPDRA